MFYFEDRRVNWRFFPFFLLVLLLIGALGIFLLLNYIDYDAYLERTDEVEEIPLLPFEREPEELGPDSESGPGQLARILLLSKSTEDFSRSRWRLSKSIYSL